MCSPEEEIEAIRQNILESMKTRLGVDFKKLLDITADMVFLRASHFLMELIQNAEDALVDVSYPGEMVISISKKRIKIIHNGKPFTKEDLDAICGVRSNKKPEMGTLGYLGIGFKAVFKISDSPQIFSGDYAFKFDKNEWENPEQIPWQIIPVSIPKERITETIDRSKTTFIIPFRKEEDYWTVKEEMGKIGSHLFMFLKKLNSIRMEDELTGERRIIKWFVEKEEELANSVKVKWITIIDGQKAQTFITFSKVFSVPDEVKKDRLTKQAKRDNVKFREVSIAFLLDEKQDLVISPKVAYGGLYSFLPLEEVRTGIRYLIQGDFIVQPGRETLNYEAKWNKWVMSCIGEVTIAAIEYFQKHPHYCSQYIPLFEIEPLADPLSTKLIQPELKRKIDEKLKDPLIPNLEGRLIPVSKAVKITEEVESFIKDGLITKSDLEIIFNETDLSFIGKDVKTGNLNVKKLNLKHLNNLQLIARKASEKIENGINFLVKLHKDAESKNPYSYIHYFYPEPCFIIDREGKVIAADQAYFSSLPQEIVELIAEIPEAGEALKNYKFVHKELEEKLGKNLLRKLGVKSISYREICEKALLPRLQTSASKPSITQLKTWTSMLKIGGVRPSSEIWVIGEDGEIVPSSKVYLPIKDGKRKEIFKKTGIKFIDLPNYIEKDKNESDWLSFFKQLGIRNLKGDREYAKMLIKKLREFPPIEPEGLILYTKALKLALEELKDTESFLHPIYVLTDKGDLVLSDSVYFSSSYMPKEDWQKQNLVNVGPYLSEEYIKEEDDIESWKNFFKELGVKETVSSEIVERYAEEYAKSLLKREGYMDVRVSKDGHDLIASKDGREYYIEVKGRTSMISEIKLTASEVKNAVNKKEQYILIVVFNIPNKPRPYMIKNPIEKVKEWHEITIPKETIEKFPVISD